MRVIRLISRLLTGIVFVFSGFVKAIDPLGSTYKFTDYFNAFHLGFLEPFAMPLAILLSSLELVIGISLLLGYRKKFISWILLLFMSFFTILTLILALTNPVHDCGCFGDALILTNWETFLKNVVLMGLTVIIFMGRKEIESGNTGKEWLVISGFFLVAVSISLYCYNNLPLLDFRPFSVGTYIPDQMIIPEDAPQSEFETRLYYRNLETGKEKEFNMSDFPRDSTRWEFVDAVSKQISEGYEPPIHDFNVIAPDGSEITDEVLSFEGYTFLLVAYNIMEPEWKSLTDANEYFRLSQAVPGIRFFALTASLREEIDSLRKELSLEYDFCQVDEITLKTIIRSNPGLLLINNGTIMEKWPDNRFPDVEEFNSYKEILENFPFCTGCDLETISQAPPGARPDEYESLLYYKNITTDSIYEFSIDNFPRDSENWIFENSVTRLTEAGFKDPLSSFKISSAYGMDLKDVALNNDAYTLMFFLEDPAELSEQQFQAFNKFGGMAMDYLPDRVDVYAITGLEDQEILDFTLNNTSPFEYYTGSEYHIARLAGEEIRIVLIKNGKVVFNWRGSEIPDPEILSNLNTLDLRDPDVIIKPAVIKGQRMRAEKRIVYIFIISLLFTGLVLRIYFNRNSRDA